MYIYLGSASTQGGDGATSSPARPANASPPATRRRIGETSSPAPLPPTSPRTDQTEAGAFSSPQPMPPSEVDMSSPLNYGTPSSRITNTPRGTPYPSKYHSGHCQQALSYCKR